jgi:hypothetical protein
MPGLTDEEKDAYYVEDPSEQPERTPATRMETGQEGPNDRHDTENEKDTPEADESASRGGEGAEEESLDEELLQRAQAVGLTNAEARQFSPDRLDLFVSATEQRLAQASQAATPEGTPEGEQPEEGPEEPEDEDIYTPDLDPDVYDPGIIEEFKRMYKSFTEQLEQARKEAEQVAQQQGPEVGSAEAEQLQQAWDSGLSELGGPFSDLLGEGSTAELEDNSQELANREVVARQAEILLDQYNAAGKQAPAPAELAQMAAKHAFPDAVAEMERQQLTKQVNQRRGQALGRPAKRTSDVPTDPDEAAQDFVRSFFAERGGHDGAPENAGVDAEAMARDFPDPHEGEPSSKEPTLNF